MLSNKPSDCLQFVSLISKEELQQRCCVGRQHHSERGGRCGADGHKSVTEMPHYLPTHPATRSRARLQTRAGTFQFQAADEVMTQRTMF